MSTTILTRPFIQPIAAFNATSGTNMNVCVMGGANITHILYTIMQNNILIAEQISATASPQDIGGEDVRTFTVPLVHSAVCNIANNNTYQVKVKTYSSTLGIYSDDSSYTVFSCYVAPTLAYTYGGSAITNSTVFTTSSPSISTTFTPSVGSNAILDKISVSVIGVDSQSNESLVYENDAIYSPFGFSLKNMRPTTTTAGSTYTPIYTRYILTITAKTIQGMVLTQTYNNITVNYTISTSSNDIKVENDCTKGAIKVTANIYRGLFNYYSKIWITRKLADQTLSTPPSITLLELDGTETIIPTQSSQGLYFYDYYTGNAKVYYYTLHKETSGGEEFESEVEVMSVFNSAFVADGTTSFNITTQWNLGSLITNMKVAQYEPYGNKYPFVAYNASTNFVSGNDTAVLLAPTSTNRAKSILDRIAQTNLVKQFNDWLTNGKVKVKKSFNGDIYIIAITSAISNTYYQELTNGLASTAFGWVEVGDFTNEYFEKLGIKNSFTLVQTTY